MIGGGLPSSIRSVRQELSVSSAADPAGSGDVKSAWRIADAGSWAPIYSACFDTACGTGGLGAQLALQQGWRVELEARLVSDSPVDQRGLGMVVWLGNRPTRVTFDLTPDKNLRASVWSGAAATLQSSVTLTSGRNGTAAYHQYALEYEPGSGIVSLEFDGVPQLTITGSPVQAHPDIFQWGDILGLATSGGTTHYSRISFEILPPFLPGDYDHDGRIATADYVVWRDAVRLGTDAADGNGDGRTNIGDYNIWKRQYLQRAGAAVLSGPRHSRAVQCVAACRGLLCCAARLAAADPAVSGTGHPDLSATRPPTTDLLPAGPAPPTGPLSQAQLSQAQPLRRVPGQAARRVTARPCCC